MLVEITGSWFRFDRQHPDDWNWTALATPSHRFDSISGQRRLRYAGRTFAGAARERFDVAGRVITALDGDDWAVELAGAVRVVDLRADATLDLLHLDDRINTGRLTLDRRDGDDVLDTCGTLTDRLFGWFGVELSGIVYRSRTTPERSANLAFCQTADLRVVDARRVRDLGERLVELVLRHRFYIDAPFAP
jgi:hypothetical protein